jgi:hypothetical protein
MIAALSLAAIITVVTMTVAADGKFEAATLLFLGWAVSPYACFFAAGRIMEKLTSAPRLLLICGAISILMLGFTVLAYVEVLIRPSSTAGLIFLLAPLWLYIGSFFLLAAGLLSVWLTGRREE